MTKEQLAELEASTAEAKTKAQENPDDQELQKAVQDAETKLNEAKALSQIPKKKEHTPLERALYARKKIDEQIATLQGDDLDEEEDDDAPVTVGMLKQRDAEKAQKTALTLADSIEDEHERDLVKHHLSTTIKPSGNAEQDLKNARAIVNSVKNAQIAEEAARKANPKAHGSPSGAPGKMGDPFEPTPEEAAMMRPPFSLSQAEVIAARPKAQ